MVVVPRIEKNMNILITGGAGFIGQRLAKKLLQLEELVLDGISAPVEKILLADRAHPKSWHPGLETNPAVEVRYGDIGDPGYVRSLFDQEIDVVFHLASIVSGQGEQDFDLALRVNLEGLRHLFEQIRRQHNNTRVVFTSSIAAYGGDNLPDIVDDYSKLTPTTTYGVTKTIGELLINEYSRKQFFDGRSARLPTVVIRPGKPNKAASSFVSGLFREPLAGESCVIPVDPAQPMSVLGYRATVDGIIRLAELSSDKLGTDRGVGLPAFNVTVRQLMEALKNATGRQNPGEHILRIDDAIVAICSGWPKSIDSSRALALGFPIEAKLEEIVEYYVEDYISI